MELADFFRENASVAVAFSGGVDSAYLLYAAKRYAVNVTAYTVKSAFQPRFETQDALRLAQEIGVPLRLLPVELLCDSAVCDNPPDRCYHCKKRMLAAIAAAAKQDGYTLLLDGTNASDGERPGRRALRELCVRSPLAECMLSKQEIRSRARQAGLSVWDKPPYACLATRIPTGTRLTAALLQRAETAENYLFSLGFRDFRVRQLENAARIQLPDEQLPQFLAQKKEITAKLKQWYDAVLLDMEGR